MSSDSGLRQRKSEEVRRIPTSEYVKRYVEAIAEKSPASMKKYLHTAAPLIGKACAGIEITIPYFVYAFEKLKEFWIYLSPYKPELLAPAGAGLIMCFFGGEFLTLIAAAEAYKMCGYKESVQCLKDLAQDFEEFLRQNKEDDAKDDDGDGTPDVLQVTPEELARRKVLLFARSVDPKRMSTAIAGLNAGFLAVVATLKLQFAKAITLGNAIGEILEVPAKKFLLPLIESALPVEYKKWAEPSIEYTVRMMAISIAWFIQRIISAFHSAIRGGVMCTRNVLDYLSEMKYFNIDHENTYVDEIAGYALAALGFWFQLRTGFRLPFPFNILLLPFTLAEWYLMWIVNSK